MAQPMQARSRVIKKIQPQDAGARRWADEFGECLVCSRRRIDPVRLRRQTTVEIVVDEAPTLASIRVAVRVAWAETQVRQAVKAAGGKWDAAAGVWTLPLGHVRQLALADCIVGAGG